MRPASCTLNLAGGDFNGNTRVSGHNQQEGAKAVSHRVAWLNKGRDEDPDGVVREECGGNEADGESGRPVVHAPFYFVSGECPLLQVWEPPAPCSATRAKNCYFLFFIANPKEGGVHTAQNALLSAFFLSRCSGSIPAS